MIQKKVFGLTFVILVAFLVVQDKIIISQTQVKNFFDFDIGNIIATPSNSSTSKKLAVIVPYRNCSDELKIFVPHMTKFLSFQKIPHHIFIVNQSNDLRFNRATLINVGFLYVERKFDCIVMHDVDLVPLNPKISYKMPENNSARHVVSYFLHPLGLKHPNFYGGIVAVPSDVFRRVDGMCNDYWGWGLEDDEFKNNLLKHKVKLTRTLKNIGTDWTNSFISIHTVRRSRDKKKCKNQRKLFRTRPKDTGLKNTTYSLLSVEEKKVKSAKYTLINVDVLCERNKTPWCSCD